MLVTVDVSVLVAVDVAVDDPVDVTVDEISKLTTSIVRDCFETLLSYDGLDAFVT